MEVMERMALYISCNWRGNFRQRAKRAIFYIICEVEHF